MRIQLGLAIESGGIGSWEWDLAARTMSGNSRLLEMFGFAGDPEHVARPVSAFIDRVHPEDRPRVAGSVATALETGGEYADEYRVLRPDGSERWLAARGRALYDAQGTAVQLVGAVYDTTDRRVAAESVQSEASLMALIARASDLLASSLEAEDAVRSFARLVVPVLADWSVVSLVGEDGRLADVDWWHHDPAKRDLTGLFARHRLDDREEAVGSLAALRSGEPFVENVDALGVAVPLLRSEVAIRAVTELGLRSVCVFPLMIDDRVIGLITLARDENRPPFSPAEIRAASDLSRRAGITLANAQSFGREREMSEQLQRSMLTAPVAPDDVEVAVRYIPAARAAQIGGDWYDAFAQEDGATVLVVGDVVGHDSVAAAVMGQLRSVLRGIAVANGGGPAELLGDLDRALVTLRMSTNATVVVARVEEREDGREDPDLVQRRPPAPGDDHHRRPRRAARVARRAAGGRPGARAARGEPRPGAVPHGADVHRRARRAPRPGHRRGHRPAGGRGRGGRRPAAGEAGRLRARRPVPGRAGRRRRAAGAAPQALLRAAELQGHRVVDQVVEVLAVALEVGDQPVQVAADRLDVGLLEHAGPELAQPPEQDDPLPVQAHLPAREPRVAVTGALSEGQHVADARPSGAAPATARRGAGGGRRGLVSAR